MKFIDALIILLFLLGLFAGGTRHTIEDIQRRAFLAGAAAAWHPGLDRWVFNKIDRTDPDWEEAFQAWRATEKR